MRDKEKLLECGNKAQLEKLELYNFKPNWKNQSIETFIQGLVNEMIELKQEIKNIIDCPDYKNSDEFTKKLRLEAADVANYAHMIIQRCDEVLDM